MTTSSVKNVDIAVIGAGLAGLSATLEAAATDSSLKILLIERESKVGGNSAKASSGINAAVSLEDVPVYEQDTLKSGGGLAAEKLVDILVKQSPSAIKFLEQSDVDLSVLCQLGGHSTQRTHRNKSGPNVGFAIISALQKKLVEFTNIELITGASAQKLLFEKDDATQTTKVTGLEVKKQNDGEVVTVHAGALILATGGFSASTNLLKRFSPGMEVFPTTNGPWADGAGILLAETLDAELVLMDKVQLHPTGFINPKDRNASHRFLAPEAIRGSGALLINTEGKRFVNELSTRDKVSQAILAQPKQTAYMFLFDGAAALASSLGFYKHIGVVKQVNSVAEAADYYQLDAEVVLNELNAYADVANGTSKSKDPFAKEYFPYPVSHISSINQPVEIHVMEVAPTVHYCMGGVKINENAQVLGKDGKLIQGIYAAGEVSGGVHGANRLGGNSLAECVVFGRIAAQQAIYQLRASS